MKIKQDFIQGNKKIKIILIKLRHYNIKISLMRNDINAKMMN